MSNLYIGDLIATIGAYAVLIIPIIIIFLLYKTFKRGQTKLEIEKQNSLLLQKRIDELNERVIAIEKILKEVE